MSSRHEESLITRGYQAIGKVFAGATPGIIICGLQGRFVHCNDAFARMVDRTREEIANCNVLNLIHPEDISRYQELLKQLIAKQIPHFVIEKRYVRPDGTDVWVRNSVSLVERESAGSCDLISICEDICDRKRAEQAVKDHEQLAALGRLASAIVHEIRNPLEGATNLTFLAQKSTSLDEARMYLKAAEEELARAGNIIALGLQFPRQVVAPERVAMEELLQSVLRLLSGRLERGHVRVDFSCTAKPTLLCFPGEIRQVLVNLIVNAIDAMPSGGLVRIRVKPATDWRTDVPGVRITIADTGVGMSRVTRRRIYEAFFTTKGPAGSGIGLWVSANIVNKHRGSIHVRSRNNPRSSGTAFTMIFPDEAAEGKPPGIGISAP